MFARSLCVLRADLRRHCPILLIGARLVSGADGKLTTSSDAPPQGDTRPESYRQLDNLDFPTAAKILFNDNPNNKKKKFGLDFHLVQLFFVCMPSLAVYLVAQYARYEMRKMEAELEKKKKQAAAEEEERANLAAEADSFSPEELKKTADQDLSKVTARLEALEAVIKEIVAEKKKVSEKPREVEDGNNKGFQNYPPSVLPVKVNEQGKNEGGQTNGGATKA